MPDPYRILLSKRVAKDLQSIFDYISKDSPANAAMMVSRILEAIDTLSIFPGRNVLADQHPRIKSPIRTLPVQSYLIFFRVLEKQRIVRILRVRHGAMRRPKRFD